jgi:hypothetical protein
VGVCLFLPGTLLTGLGAAIFGAYLGFIYVWIGAMIGFKILKDRQEDFHSKHFIGGHIMIDILKLIIFMTVFAIFALTATPSGQRLIPRMS